MHLDVLVYNIEYSGGPETDKVIRRLDADVVGVLESYDAPPRDRRGEPGTRTTTPRSSCCRSTRSSSRRAATASTRCSRSQPGYVIPFFNTHLDYVEWGPRCLAQRRLGRVGDRDRERVRTSAMEQPIAAMAELLDDGYPLFLTGDFNQPSSLDYTEETVGTRDGDRRAGAVAGEREAVRPRVPRHATGRSIPTRSRTPASPRQRSRASASTTSTRRARRRRSTASSSASRAARTSTSRRRRGRPTIARCCRASR